MKQFLTKNWEKIILVAVVVIFLVYLYFSLSKAGQISPVIEKAIYLINDIERKLKEATAPEKLPKTEDYTKQAERVWTDPKSINPVKRNSWVYYKYIEPEAEAVVIEVETSTRTIYMISTPQPPVAEEIRLGRILLSFQIPEVVHSTRDTGEFERIGDKYYKIIEETIPIPVSTVKLFRRKRGEQEFKQIAKWDWKENKFEYNKKMPPPKGFEDMFLDRPMEEFTEYEYYVSVEGELKIGKEEVKRGEKSSEIAVIKSGRNWKIELMKVIPMFDKPNQINQVRIKITKFFVHKKDHVVIKTEERFHAQIYDPATGNLIGGKVKIGGEDYDFTTEYFLDIYGGVNVNMSFTRRCSEGGNCDVNELIRRQQVDVARIYKKGVHPRVYEYLFCKDEKPVEIRNLCENHKQELEEILKKHK